MKLIVGLGNPGKTYARTRHNLGFMVVDAFADAMNVDIDREDFHGVYCKFKTPTEDVFLLKPLTYMNLSGQCVREFADYFRIDPSDIIVIYDDLSLPTGKIRLRENGSSGGQKGMKDILNRYQTENIKRIRIGIGAAGQISVVDYVLGTPGEQERILLEDGIHKAVLALKMILKDGFSQAMNRFNSAKE